MPKLSLWTAPEYEPPTYKPEARAFVVHAGDWLKDQAGEYLERVYKKVFEDKPAVAYEPFIFVRAQRNRLQIRVDGISSSGPAIDYELIACLLDVSFSHISELSETDRSLIERHLPPLTVAGLWKIYADPKMLSVDEFDKTERYLPIVRAWEVVTSNHFEHEAELRDSALKRGRGLGGYAKPWTPEHLESLRQERDRYVSLQDELLAADAYEQSRLLVCDTSMPIRAFSYRERGKSIHHYVLEGPKQPDGPRYPEEPDTVPAAILCLEPDAAWLLFEWYLPSGRKVRAVENHWSCQSGGLPAEGLEKIGEVFGEEIAELVQWFHGETALLFPDSSQTEDEAARD